MIDNEFLPSLKLYRMIIGLFIILMSAGIVIVYIEDDRIISLSLILQCLFVVSISILLVIFPKKDTLNFRATIIFLMSAYFFFMYLRFPDRFALILLICFIPVIPVLFLHIRLFYITLLGNITIMLCVIIYLMMNNTPGIHSYSYLDFIGVITNFLGTQLLLLFLFLLFQKRMKDQELYYVQVKQAEKLRTTGQLAAAVAHEIRNPITVVKGFIQLHEKDKEIPEHIKKQYKLMLDELEAAETVISDFLSLAKPSETKTEIISVKLALHTVMDLLNSYAMNDTIHIELESETDYKIQCNIMEFKQLFVNLLKNAIEASQPGDTIHVKLIGELDELKIVIIDNGTGMNEEQLEQIGTPFYSLKAKGTGLGLMICYNIIEKYDGTIRFKSEEGKGTEVTVTFPIAQK
ncbi:integral membrane sensor signal transduction histidine kinase [Niallia circulans]|uniref:sensor histidine kinase n=1 Tax=Niallia circulans TaxID=1397 RepID=UPI00077C31F2|nr:HAMP domain-containing sensor histidine kinase [Niallia circulans]MDR4315284.1 GHKL domain-containing protein [Niallia circulans]MED3841743.1 HAMP domain-containing sensor histidine kinase [Niallia circulans]MED4245696.1 HAMP domain-containing sensor histidine kinase [Niallia circulans]MED4248170.1 HAMP domain-containing sensor histidine kinase [Niallia circulans]QKH61370.1 HAMP domain-containing histidine kinase [Niallia circulans]